MGKKGVNKMTLIGVVGKDPDINTLPSGKLVANFSLATGDFWKDKVTQEPKETTEWHRVAAFGVLAEIIRDRIQKGTKVYLEAESKTRTFKASDGVTEIYRQEFILDIGATIQILNNGKVRPQQQQQQ